MKVDFIDKMGSDLTVVNAARVSYSKESKWDDELNQRLPEKDEKLIKFLAKHNHWSPFGHASIQFRIKAPVFVAKSLLKLKGIEYEERNIAQGWNVQDLLEQVPNARTMPQIWLDDKHIGGFKELQETLKD